MKIVRSIGGADAAKTFRELLRRFYIQHINGQVRKIGSPPLLQRGPVLTTSALARCFGKAR